MAWVRFFCLTPLRLPKKTLLIILKRWRANVVSITLLLGENAAQAWLNDEGLVRIPNLNAAESYIPTNIVPAGRTFTACEEFKPSSLICSIEYCDKPAPPLGYRFFLPLFAHR